MGSIEIREPKQQRSIEKKKRIIEAGFKLFCEKGYHNTNTAEIAKEAGVSTGIVYNYFENKKSIFMDAITFYSEQISKSFYSRLNEIERIDDIAEFLDKVIDSFVQSHDIIKSAHEEMMAMSHLDEDVGTFFREFEMSTITILANKLSGLGIEVSNPLEKMHIAFNLIESYCHEVVYHNNKMLDYQVMKMQIINIIYGMLKTP